MGQQQPSKLSLWIQSFILALLVVIGFQFFFGHKGEKAGEVSKETKRAQSVKVSDIPSVKELGQRVNVETPLYRAEFSTVNGRLVSLFIKKYDYQLVSPYSKVSGLYPLTTLSLNEELSKKLSRLNLTPSSLQLKVEGSPKKLLFSGEIDGKRFIKELTFYPDSYRIDVKVEFEGEGGEFYTILGPDINLSASKERGHVGPVVETEDKVYRLDPKDLNGFVSFNKVVWAGEEEKYFLMAAKDKNFSAMVKEVRGDHTLVEAFVDEFTFYGGPKELKELEALGMESAIDFGILGFLAKPLLKFFIFLHKFVPNWGVEIIIFTLIIKLILHPLTHKSFVSMKKMQDLAPRLEEIKRKYGNDPQKLQEETMKLYREMGVNPASGCLPMLLQIPIFIALYELFLNAVELKGASFLWIRDLSQPDPTYVLPILMGLSMILQQFLTPTTNKQQQYIFYAMAVFFTFLFASFPAGLVLYWFTNNVITAIQNLIIMKLTANKEGA
ncbi:MAG: membrane protein insertase YidC [Desulfurobacteriaceae bacterium]